MAKFKNFIGGKWQDAKEGKTYRNVNPADTSDVIGEFPSSTPADVDEAVQAAKKAFKSWRKIPAPKRGEILFKSGEMLIKRKDELAREMTREMGKVLKETNGDVQEARSHYSGSRRDFYNWKPQAVEYLHRQSIRALAQKARESQSQDAA